MKKAYLNHWYLKKMEETADGSLIGIAKGFVTGHDRISDTTHINTSMIVKIKVDWKNEVVIVTTLNTTYYCYFKDCDFSHMDTYLFLPKLKEYMGKYVCRKEYVMNDDSILLVFSDRERYYFEAGFIYQNSVKQELLLRPHIGTFQDSCLIWPEGAKDMRIDIRYFPHRQHLEFYKFKVDGCTTCFENQGMDVIYFTTPVGVIKLNPGERKAIISSNAEEEVERLNRSDLYPLVFIDEEEWRGDKS